MTASEAHTTFIPPDPEHLADLFPGYQIIRLIACGGMGAVYEAVQLSLDRSVAIKILPQEFAADESFCTAFETEAKAMARLNHPNLVSVYDFGQAGGMLYIIMEYVPGFSVFNAADGQPILQQEVAPLITAICRGLAHAHENGIIHRDIKPANILLDHNNEPKIGDFGLARPLEKQVQEGEEIFGTPGYTAPEVVDHPQSIDHRADIFSIGVLLHELLTGILPDADPRPASAICHCDPRFDAIIRKATNPNPGERYHSAADIAAEIEKIRTTAGPRVLQTAASAGRSPRIAPSRYPVRTKSGGSGFIYLLMLIAAGAVAYLYLGREKPVSSETSGLPAESKDASISQPAPPTPPAMPEIPREQDDQLPEIPSTPPPIEGAHYWQDAAASMDHTAAGARFEVRSADIGGTSDSGIFKPESWSGDGVFLMFIGNLEGNPEAKAGIMIRENIGAGARHAFLARTAAGDTVLQIRNREEREAQEVARTTSDHTHLRITRFGNLISADASTDGSEWTEIGFIEIRNLSSQLRVGLAASSHTPTTPLGFDTRPLVTSPFDLSPTVEGAPAAKINMNELFRRARAVMSERAAPIRADFDRTNQENISTYVRTAAQYLGDSAEIQRDVDITGNIPFSFPEAFAHLEGFRNLHTSHLTRQKEIADTFNNQMAELERIYLNGINSQIERSRSEDDSGAIRILEAEKQRLTEFPSYFRILMEQNG